MYSYIRIGTALAVALCLPACATVTRGTSQKFAIESTPTGAEVTLSTGQTCTTPCKIKLKRKHAFTAKFAKDGFQPIEASVTSKMRGGGGTALAGNALVGGFIGVLVDAGNGSMNDLTPNPLKVTLLPVEAVPAAAPAVQETSAEPSAAPAAPAETPAEPAAAPSPVPSETAAAATPTTAVVAEAQPAAAQGAP